MHLLSFYNLSTVIANSRLELNLYHFCQMHMVSKPHPNHSFCHQDDDIFLIYCGLDQTDYDGSADVWLKNEDGIFTLIDSDTFLKWNSSNQRSQCLIPVDADSDGDMDIIEIVGNTDLGYKLTLQRNNKN